MTIDQNDSTKDQFYDEKSNSKQKNRRSEIIKRSNFPDKNLIALVELAIYWSKPQKIINAIIKDKKERFTYKLSRYVWHTSYSDLSEKLRLSKESIRRKLVILEELGILRREFKTVVIDSCEYHSMMFLRLNSNFLRSVTGSSKLFHLKDEGSFEQQAESLYPPKTKSPP